MKSVKIGNIAEQIRGVSYAPADASDTFSENMIPLLRANNIHDSSINYEDLVYIRNSKVANKQLLKINDILICASSGSKHLVGKAGRILEEKGTFGAFCKVLRPNPKLINPTYFAHFFQSPIYRSTISSLASGANINNIKNEHLDELSINLPDYLTQSKIAQTLDVVSQLCKTKRVQLDKLNTLASSRFVEMFGDLTSNPLKWKFASLSEVCDVRDGTHDSPSYVAAGYPLLTSKNFSSGYIDWSEVNYISKEDFDKIAQRSKVDCGDIVMPMIGTIGHPVVVDTEKEFAIKNVALIKFCGSSYSNVFIKAILDSDYFKRTIEGSNRGGTQKFIALGDIRRIRIPTVPFELQNEFATFIEQLDKSKVVGKMQRISLEKIAHSDILLWRLALP